jgi:hypothetical protein
MCIMSRRIDPDFKYVDLFMDELHWIKLTELAREKSVTPDKLLGAILEHFLIRMKKIEPGQISESAVKADITLEPIREDKAFFEALETQRAHENRDRQKAETVIHPQELEEFDWGIL